MEEISNIIKTLSNEWKPPIKEKRICPYCKSVMKAEKISTFGNRFVYQYKCLNDCEKKQELRKEYAIRYRNAKKIWKQVGFCRDGIKWNINNINCEHAQFIKEYALYFNRFSKSLILNGLQGTGKSIASECIVKQLIHNGKKARITNMSEINIELNQALRKDNYKQYMQELLNLDLIVIDDFGREQYNTEKSLENVFQFFNILTKERKPYIVSINPEMLSIITQKPQLNACLDRFRSSDRVQILEFKNNSFRR